MEVYVVVGGCVGDYHIIAIYQNKRDAEARANQENQDCNGLGAYVEDWEVV